MIAVIIVVSLVPSTASGAAGQPRRGGDRVGLSLALVHRNVLSATGAVRPARDGFPSALVQVRHGRSWSAPHRAVPISKRGTFSVRWKLRSGTSSVAVRAVALGSQGRRAVSAVTTLHVGSRGAAAFSIPATTRLYPGKAVGSVAAGPSGETVVKLAPGSQRPIAGGHVALAPSSGLRYGMFASVARVSRSGSGWTTTLRPASIDQVLGDVSVQFDQGVTPHVVDEHGATVDAGTRPGAIRIAGKAAFASSATSSLGSAFECNGPGGPEAGDHAFTSTGPMPLSIELSNMHAIDDFDTGSVFPSRAPFFLMQVTGQAQASIGFEAKTSFTCRLSSSFRESHRIAIPLGAVGPVPVTMYLEPTLKFEVSASGSVSLSQHHYWGITLEQDGFSPFSAKLSHSADPVNLSVGATLDASLFAGGDLSVMFGAGEGDWAAQAGIYGAFGPDFGLKTSTDRPGCLTATGKLEADLGVRLQVLVKRWEAQIASLTTKPVGLGGPWCAGDAGSSAGGSGTGSGGSGRSGGGGGGGGSGGGGGAGMSWHAVDLPVPSGGEAQSGLAEFAPACSADGTCVVTGEYSTDDGERGMIDTLSGGTWSSIEIPVPTGGAIQSGRASDAPACSDGGTCVVAGTYTEDGVTRPMIDTLSGGSWSSIEMPAPAGGVAAGGVLAPVCSADGTCVVTADYEPAGGGTRVMFDTLSGGGWSSIEAPVPVGGALASYTDYESACSADGTCVVIDDYEPAGGGTRVMIDTLSGGSWSSIEMPVPAGGATGPGLLDFYYEPACSADGTCVVTGEYAPAAGGKLVMIDTLSDGSWSSIEMPVPAGGTLASYAPSRAPACSADGTCVVTGEYEPAAGGKLVMIDTLSDGSWSSIELPVPAGGAQASYAYFEPACSADGTCVLTGTYEPTAGGQNPVMIDTLSDGSWSSIELPVPASGMTDSGVVVEERPACSADGTCVVTGTYEPTGAEGQRGMIDTLSDGVWDSIETPVPAGGVAGSAYHHYFHEANPACSADGTCVVIDEYEPAAGGMSWMIAVGESLP